MDMTTLAVVLVIAIFLCVSAVIIALGAEGAAIRASLDEQTNQIVAAIEANGPFANQVSDEDARYGP